MSIVKYLQNRQSLTSYRQQGADYNLFPLLSDYQCLHGDQLVFTGVNSDQNNPILACRFNPQGLEGHLLAAAEEDGIIGLYDTRTSLADKQPLTLFQAHRNAIFDIAWVPGGNKLVTASGDKTLRLWDMIESSSNFHNKKPLATFSTHSGSVKSVSIKPDEPSVLVSGGRDGGIMVWDTRCTPRRGSGHRPVNTIHGAHVVKSEGSRTRKSHSNRHGVTAVLFHDNKIASCGASDGTVKLWDMRRCYSNHKSLPPPCWHSYSPVEHSGRTHGFSSLVSDGSSLFASCSDNIIYQYSLATLDKAPVSGFSGHRNGSGFYVKCCLSFDGEYLLSGSSCHKAFVWKVSQPDSRPLVLEGHSEEVTCVDWCPAAIDKVVTCSDDCDLFVWRVRRGISPDHTPPCVASQYSGDDHLKGAQSVKLQREAKLKQDSKHALKPRVSMETPMVGGNSLSRKRKLILSKEKQAKRSKDCCGSVARQQSCENCTGHVQLSLQTYFESLN